ncbi:MAG: hypothetical protein HS115_06795 [Spirochaetales bacterium]|nr:hypothetical protein [Spirochaetales bacterium]
MRGNCLLILFVLSGILQGQAFDPADFALESELLEEELRIRENRAQKKLDPAPFREPAVAPAPGVPVATPAVPGPASILKEPVRTEESPATRTSVPQSTPAPPASVPEKKVTAAIAAQKPSPPPAKAPAKQLTKTRQEKAERSLSEQKALEAFQSAYLSACFGPDFKPDVLPARRNLSAPHYVVSNENRLDLFFPYIENLGGSYIGVGTDQNFILAGRARSQTIYLLDFDPLVVELNQIHALFLAESPDFAGFRRLWTDPQSEKLVSARLSLAHAGSLRRWRTAILGRFRDVDTSARKFGWQSFHNLPADFDHLRRLAQERKIIALPGDLRGHQSLRAIARRMKEEKQTIGILYLSNAEDYFRSYATGMIQSVGELPTTESSVVLRTTSTVRFLNKPAGEKFPRIPFHYNVQSLSSFQAWLKKPARLAIMLKKAKPVKQGLSLLTAGP